MSALFIIFLLLGLTMAVTAIYDFFKEPKDIRFHIFGLLVSLASLAIGTTLLITQLLK